MTKAGRGSRSAGNWQTGVTVAGGAAAAFALYCIAHSWLDVSDISPAASIRWGLLAGAPVGGLAWLLWTCRRDIAAYAGRNTCSAAVFLGGILLMLLIGGPVLHLIAAQSPVEISAARLIQEAFDLLPLSIAITAGVGAALIAIRIVAQDVLRESSIQVMAPQWLDLPEEPRLRLRRADVPAVRAAGNYCEVQAGSRVHLVRAPIKIMAARLAPLGFVRVHRSALVNLDRLRSVEANAGTVFAQLDDGSRVPVGRAFRAGLESALTERSSLGGNIHP